MERRQDWTSHSVAVLLLLPEAPPGSRKRIFDLSTGDSWPTHGRVSSSRKSPERAVISSSEREDLLVSRSYPLGRR